MSDDPRQADYLPTVHEIFSLGENGAPSPVPTPLGVVLMTQCCDMARGGSGSPVAAAVVRLEGSDASLARSGRRPRYAELSWLGPDMFADFANTGTLSFSTVLERDRVSAPTDSMRTAFANRVARRFGRFAYPDSIQPFLRRIQERIRSKAGSATSPMGICLSRVVTIRVENESGWDVDPPWDIVLTFVLHEGELPTLGTTDPRTSVPNTSSLVAEQIAVRAPGAADLNWLWQILLERIVTESLHDDDAGVVRAVVGEAVEEGEYSFMRYRRSSDLDIDDLSEFETAVEISNK